MNKNLVSASIATVAGLMLVAIAAIIANGCYSFTGASIPAHIHTIGIPVVDDISGFGQSDIRQDLTNKLIQKFTNEGSLRVASRTNADALLEVTIDQIHDDPISVRVGDVVTTKRVTIHANAIYRDQKKQKTFWEKGFSQTSDYSLAQTLAGQKRALQDAEDKLAGDVLLGVISNW